MTRKLFGTTGVRKVYGTEFDVSMAMDLGKALGTVLGDGTVLLARDARTTGRMITDAVAAGIMSTGVNVVRAGLIPTPTLAFTTMNGRFDAGVMVTASHNPSEYTGLKFWAKDSMGFTHDQESELEAVYQSKEFNTAEWDKLGTERYIDSAVDEHINALVKACDAALIKSKKFRVVVDPGNGAACVFTPYLMQRLGCRVITINGQPDGHFPGRPSEPDATTLGVLIDAVKKTGSDIGIAHDGDSDRVVFVSERGEVIRGDRTIALLGREALKSAKKKHIVTTVDSSRVLDETIDAGGGNTTRTPVGDIQVAIKVKKEEAVMGGEACGVFIFPEFDLAPEPFLAACRVLELMATTGLSFGDLISEIPVYPLMKTKIECPNEKKTEVMRKLSQTIPDSMDDVKDVLTVDGIGVFLEDAWVLVRPSGTEPVIRITCEGPTKERAEEILETATQIVEKTVGE